MTGALWRPGQVVHGLYEILDVIRSGGMGLVYRIRHRGWRMDLAVKVPRPELVVSPQGMRGFEAEAESWVRLGLHPHTVNCVYVRRLDGLPRVFAEWADGGSLAEAVRRRTIHRGGLRQLLDIAIQCAWGLAHAHASGLVHQDVKPANVLLTGEGPAGTAKVTDFGLAKARVAAGERPLGSALVSFGGLTPAYCSPEQARAAAGRPVGLTRATDVWSWGLTVLEMFTGGPPTRFGQAAREALDMFVRESRRDPVIPPLPADVEELLRRCFEPDPAARPTDMRELADELIGLYARLTCETYPRQRPHAAQLLADGLSNQALSMLDLGHSRTAEELWAQALAVDPRHLRSVFNQGLHRWRAGQDTDTHLMSRLEQAGTGSRHHQLSKYLLGLVHLERGAPEQAVPLLRDAAAEVPEAAAALDTAQRLSGPREPVTLAGHEGAVGPVATSTDGRIGVSGGEVTTYPPPPGSEGGTVCVWDLRSGRRLHKLAGHARRAESVAVSADGRIVASCGDDDVILVWDTVSGRQLHRLSSPARSVALTPDGRLLVSASADGSLLVWDTAGGRTVRTLQRPRRIAGTLAHPLVATAERVVRWDRDLSRLQVWDLTTGHLVRSLPTARMDVVLLPDGRSAVAGDEERLELWDLDTGERTRSVVPGEALGEPLAAGDDGRVVLVAGPSGPQWWDLRTGRCLRTLSTSVQKLALRADGRVALSSSYRALQLWEVTGPGPGAPWSYARPVSAVEHSQGARAVVRALDRADRHVGEDQWAAAADELRTGLRVPGYAHNRELLDWLARVGRHGRRRGLLAVWQTRELPVPDVEEPGYSAIGGTTRSFSMGPASVLSVSSDGRFFLTCAFRTMNLWDLQTGEARGTLSTHGPALRAATLSPDGSVVVSGAEDKTVVVWDTRTCRPRHVLTGHPGEVDAVGVSSDGRLAVSGCRNGTVRVWDLADGSCLRVLTGHPAWITTVAMSLDTRLVLVGGFDGTGAVWDVAATRLLRILPGRAQHVTPAMVSVDGRIVLSPGHASSGIWVSDPWTNTLYDMLPGHHPETVTSVVAHPDGSTGYSAGHDGTVRVWDLADSTCRHVLSGHEGAVHTLVPCSGGRFALSGGADGTLRVWDLQDGRCLHTLAGHLGGVVWLGVSRDAQTAVSVGKDDKARVWRLAWDFDFPAPQDWHESARPYVDAFRRRRAWIEADVGHLLDTLTDAGFGWLRRETVRDLARGRGHEPW
ncbi:protein kinase domain-containing protein [Streptomyces sp. NRRL B-1140]|uniref:protein kinase domain-containing protein n=1 Tax=Streptomyces sp. NRRL B-1140 TaxID=1415549 RepID=UPI00099D0F35|nr:protein kinase [Streptomyces sp. NRRL B-1140]